MIKAFKEQKELIEEVGLGIEKRLGLSPLASRIYALLTLSSYDGLTFEEIREVIGTSKSSASVNLNVLTQLQYVGYHTKPGDRKKYFRVLKYSQLRSLEHFHQTIENEIELVDKITAFNKIHHPEKFTDEKSLGEIMQVYFREQQKIVQSTMKKISTFRKNDVSV